MTSCSIYIHFPFCKTRCPYCDFFSTTEEPVPVGRYRDALELEWQLRRPLVRDARLLSIYLGGGTPSLLSGAEVASILALFPLDSAHEVTVEANPGDVRSDWYRALLNAGVNRFSIGVQALSDDRLNFLGRRHTLDEAMAAVERALESGTRSVSADIIYGTPGHSPEALALELSRVAALGVHHLSCYELTVGKGTALGQWVEEGTVSMPGEDEMAALFQSAALTLGALGHEQYEVSNFAVPGHRCRHNEHYWRGGSYIGLGLGAHGFITDTDGRMTRYANLGDLESYFGQLRNNPPVSTAEGLGNRGVTERISDLDYARERMMLGLRTADGAPFSTISPGVTPRLREEWQATAERLVRDRWCRWRGGHLVATKEGLLHADTLAEAFF